MFELPELDRVVRDLMVREFQSEETSDDPGPYRPANLTEAGLAVYPRLVEDALQQGDEVSLGTDLADPAYWYAQEQAFSKKGRPFVRRVNPNAQARRVAATEFNTWYVRGLAIRLRDDGVTSCEIFTADPNAWWAECRECAVVDGWVVQVADVLDGHRIRYHAPTVDGRHLTVPVHPNCHHSIRRQTA